ncbi:MAG: hypothetical protein JO340_12705 [Acidobacteriaceae bacterium]|nr:hypothetical protein [Acidobacteriaceae bacterium]
MIDKSWGHGYYGCAGCCGYEGQQLLPNPFSGGVGTQGNNTAESEDMCSNSWVDVTSETYDWASTNSGIVNVASAVSHFMSPGSVTGSGQVQLQRQLARLDCPVQGFEPQNTQYSCTVPTGETTSFYEWGDNNPQAGDNASIAGWLQSLTPASAGYTNGIVSESNFSPATDSCYFNGSPYPPVSGVTGSNWTVVSSEWGPDWVGYVYAEFAYYQTTRPAMNLSLPCGFTMFQQLSFKCPDGQPTVFDYPPIILRATISGTGITVSREGQTVARTLIGN